METFKINRSKIPKKEVVERKGGTGYYIPIFKKYNLTFYKKGYHSSRKE
jgi:hypothetical protein